MLMCSVHWFAVPRLLQQAVWAAYREGQCDEKNPSLEWHEAADAAIGLIAVREGRPISENQIEALKALDYYEVAVNIQALAAKRKKSAASSTKKEARR